MPRNRILPRGVLPRGGLGKAFKKIINKLITYFDEPHEKLLFNIILIVLFTFIYKLIDMFDENAFSKRLSTSDAAYFASITNFTLGFGDIIPQSNLARMTVVLHSLTFWMVAIA